MFMDKFSSWQMTIVPAALLSLIQTLPCTEDHRSRQKLHCTVFRGARHPMCTRILAHHTLTWGNFRHCDVQKTSTKDMLGHSYISEVCSLWLHSQGTIVQARVPALLNLLSTFRLCIGQEQIFRLGCIISPCTLQYLVDNGYFGLCCSCISYCLFSQHKSIALGIQVFLIDNSYILNCINQRGFTDMIINICGMSFDLAFTLL